MEASALAVSPCDAIAERIFELLDGEMNAAEEAEVRQHLAACATCAHAVHRDAAFLRFLERRARIQPAPPAFRDRIAQLLAAARPTAGTARGGGQNGDSHHGGGDSGPPGTPDCPADPT